MEVYWTIEEVAETLKISRAQVYRLMALKEIPYILVSPNIKRFDPEAIRKWAQSRTVNTDEN